MTPKGTTKANGQKHALDKFYTKPKVARDCLDLLDLPSFGLIIEPSAGGGAFSDPLLDNPTLNVLAFDLDPENPRIKKQDWFKYKVNSNHKTLVVGNPPFGQQCKLALGFINHAFNEVGADTVAFVLPRSFRKPSVQARITKKAHLIKEIVLEPASFTLDGDDYTISTVFQVWQISKDSRVAKDYPLTSKFFEFTKQGDPHDFALRRVGGRAGHAFVDNANTSAQSNYFIKIKGKRSLTNTLKRINTLDFSVADDGTGPKTLSKRELVQILDSAFTPKTSTVTSTK